MVKALAGLRGLREDPEVAARFRAWEKLPSDSLGAHLFRHYRDNGFALPGEKGGFSEAGLYHDFSHVLAGYDTTPQGETLVGGFIAGYREKRPDHGLFTALFVLSIFSAGVDVTPTGVGAETGTVGGSRSVSFSPSSGARPCCKTFPMTGISGITSSFRSTRPAPVSAFHPRPRLARATPRSDGQRTERPPTAGNALPG